MIKVYTTANTVSVQVARTTLIKEGIYTKTGKLAKKYGGEAKANSTSSAK
jgi:hypothetical protein